MSYLVSQQGYGDFLAGDGYTILAPSTGAVGARGLLLCHGATGTNAAIKDGRNTPNTTKTMRALAAAGFLVISPDLGGPSTFANDASIAACAAYKTALQTLGAKTDGIVIAGNSMGAQVAMSYTRVNKASVKALLLFQPLCDVADIVSRNVLGLASTVHASYGGAYSNATYGAAHNPAVFKADLANVPGQVWYSNTDATVVPSSTVTPVLSAWTGVQSFPVAGAHGDPLFANVDIPTVLSFVKQYA